LISTSDRVRVGVVGFSMAIGAEKRKGGERGGEGEGRKKKEERKKEREEKQN
jgi:hypothetical protein